MDMQASMHVVQVVMCTLILVIHFHVEQDQIHNV